MHGAIGGSGGGGGDAGGAGGGGGDGGDAGGAGGAHGPWLTAAQVAGQIDEIGTVGAASREAKTWLILSRTLAAHQLEPSSPPRQFVKAYVQVQVPPQC